MSTNQSETGLGLTIVIQSEYRSSHDWRAFACWYSIRSFLPDATFAIAAPKTANTKMVSQCFRWARRAGISMRPATGVVIDDHVIMVRDTNLSGDETILGSGLCADCRTDSAVPFVYVGEKCGKYDKERWPHAPFAQSFLSPDVTENERLVLQMWQKMASAYTAMLKL